MPRYQHCLCRQFEEAEPEPDAAKKPSQIRAAATKKRLALEGLARLDEQEKGGRPTRGRGSEGGSC
jgi:hypothetical protein